MIIAIIVYVIVSFIAGVQLTLHAKTTFQKIATVFCGGPICWIWFVYSFITVAIDVLRRRE